MKTQPDIKTLKLIHTALTIGQAGFAIVVFLLTGSTAINISDTSDMFLMIVPLVSISALFASTFLFKQKISQIREDQTPKEKYDAYTSAAMFRYVLTEVPSLLCCMAYLMTGNFIYLVLCGCLVLFFLILRPTEARLKRDVPHIFDEVGGFYS